LYNHRKISNRTNETVGNSLKFKVSTLNLIGHNKVVQN
jgi:hypothetical protein